MIILLLWLTGYPLAMKYIEILDRKQLKKEYIEKELKKQLKWERLLYLVVAIILVIYEFLKMGLLI